MHALTIQPRTENAAIRRLHSEFVQWDRDEVWSLYRRAKGQSFSGSIDLEIAERITGAPCEIVLLLFDLIDPYQSNISLERILSTIALFSGCSWEEKIRFISCTHDSTATGKITGVDFLRMLNNMKALLFRIFGYSCIKAWLGDSRLDAKRVSKEICFSYEELLSLCQPFREQYESLPWSKTSLRHTASPTGSSNRMSTSLAERFKRFFAQDRANPGFTSPKSKESESRDRIITTESKPAAISDMDARESNPTFSVDTDSDSETDLLPHALKEERNGISLQVESSLHENVQFEFRTCSITSSEIVDFRPVNASSKLLTTEVFGTRLSLPGHSTFTEFVQVVPHCDE